MGLFDSVLGAMQSQTGAAGGQGDMMSTVMALVNEHGGLAGLVQKLLRRRLRRTGCLMGRQRNEPAGHGRADPGSTGFPCTSGHRCQAGHRSGRCCQRTCRPAATGGRHADTRWTAPQRRHRSGAGRTVRRQVTATHRLKRPATAGHFYVPRTGIRPTFPPSRHKPSTDPAPDSPRPTCVSCPATLLPPSSSGRRPAD